MVRQGYIILIFILYIILILYMSNVLEELEEII
jgi:hypothetical protein